jgi:protein-S-isoprenylcysteine O-methyltransferase Ste14
MSGERFHDPRWLIRPFYLVQAIAVAAWWAMLWTWPVTRDPFLVDGMGWAVFRGFMLPDAILLVAGSLFAAWRPVGGLRLLILGAVVYPALLCLAWSLDSASGHASGLAMAAMAIGNAAVCSELKLFRTASAASPRVHLAVTLAQLVIFWSILLLIVPWLIANCDPQRTLPAPWMLGLGWTVFACASVVGISSAVVMSWSGLGTPLPVAAPSRLVTCGPYAWMRNPMACAGIVQGLAIALILGSPMVMLYALAGAAAWHVIARPAEEADLAARFGDVYQRYRADVPLWFPRTRPWQNLPRTTRVDRSPSS